MIIGGSTVVYTIKSNTRKARVTAHALEQQRKKADDLCEAISKTAASIARLDRDVESLRSAAREDVTAIPESLAPPPADEAPSEQFAARPGLKTDPERLVGLEKELNEQLHKVEAVIYDAGEIEAIANSDRASVRRDIDPRRNALKLSSLNASLSRIQKSTKDADKKLELARTIAKEVEDLSKKIIEDDRRRKEEEARKSAEKKRREQLQADTKQAEKHRAQMLASIKDFKMEQAHATLTAPGISYHTDEGTAQHQLMVEQSKELLAMKTTLLGFLSEKPFTWGWRQDGSPRDITGATVEHLLVGERKIPWTQVSLPQMWSIMNEYFCGTKVKPTIRSNYSIPVSIYFATKGKIDRAETILETGVSMLPALETKANRLARPLIDSL